MESMLDQDVRLMGPSHLVTLAQRTSIFYLHVALSVEMVSESVLKNAMMETPTMVMVATHHVQLKMAISVLEAHLHLKMSVILDPLLRS